MYLYSIIIYILRRFLPGKWVPLGQTAEGGSKHSNFFTRFLRPLLHILLRNVSIISDTALDENVVFFRYGWYAFTSAYPYLQVFYTKFEIRTNDAPR